MEGAVEIQWRCSTATDCVLRHSQKRFAAYVFGTSMRVVGCNGNYFTTTSPPLQTVLKKTYNKLTTETEEYNVLITVGTGLQELLHKLSYYMEPALKAGNMGRVGFRGGFAKLFTVGIASPCEKYICTGAFVRVVL